MTAEQAREFGIIDKVLTRRDEVELGGDDGQGLG